MKKVYSVIGAIFGILLASSLQSMEHISPYCLSLEGNCITSFYASSNSPEAVFLQACWNMNSPVKELMNLANQAGITTDNKKINDPLGVICVLSYKRDDGTIEEKLGYYGIAPHVLFAFAYLNSTKRPLLPLEGKPAKVYRMLKLLNLNDDNQAKLLAILSERHDQAFKDQSNQNEEPHTVKNNKRRCVIS